MQEKLTAERKLRFCKKHAHFQGDSPFVRMPPLSVTKPAVSVEEASTCTTNLHWGPWFPGLSCSVPLTTLPPRVFVCLQLKVVLAAEASAISGKSSVSLGPSQVPEWTCSYTSPFLLLICLLF